MKKRSFIQLALCGVLAGVCASSSVEAEEKKAAETQTDPNTGNLGYHLLSEDELLLELNDEGYKLYMSLDAEGKALAREVASARCNGTNKCEGLNACKTDKNDCAGKGKCEGKGKCALSDKNLAVKLVAKKMAAKRANVLQSSPKQTH